MPLSDGRPESGLCLPVAQQVRQALGGFRDAQGVLQALHAQVTIDQQHFFSFPGQCQQDCQLFLQLRRAAAGCFGREVKQTEQRLRRKAAAFQIPQMDAAKHSVQQFGFRADCLLKRSQLLPQPCQSRRRIRQGVAGAKDALVQSLQQVPRAESRPAGALVQQKCSCQCLFPHGSYHTIPPSVRQGPQSKNTKNFRFSPPFFLFSSFFPFFEAFDKFGQNLPPALCMMDMNHPYFVL